jgi:uncharacterized protein
MEEPILTVPGYTGSGPNHWQTLWEPALAATRAEQRDWDHPRRDEWIAALDAAISSCPAPPWLVAHSLGCIAVARWASAHRRPVRGAFLVAPPGERAMNEIAPERDFSPAPRERLPFPALLVASTDDPYVELLASRRMAEDWGAELVVVGAAGHINTASGHGPWPEGRALFEEWRRRVAGGPGR